MKIIRIVLSYLIIIIGFYIAIKIIYDGNCTMSDDFENNKTIAANISIVGIFILKILVGIDLSLSIIFLGLCIFPYPYKNYIDDSYLKNTDNDKIHVYGQEADIWAQGHKNIICPYFVIFLLSFLKIWSIIFIEKIIFFLGNEK